MDALIGLANELDSTGWCRLAPYGETVKQVRVALPDGASKVVAYVQVLDRPSATALANGFNSLWGRLKRALATVPLFDGHPDLHRVAPNNADAAAGEEIPVGTINGLKARDDGLYAQVGLFPAGQALANEGRKFISPLWWTEPVSQSGDVVRVRPVELISGGLTDRPNIPGGEALANQKQGAAENPAQNAPGADSTTDTNMKQLLIGLLAARGIALANAATEEDILGKTAGVITTLEGNLTTANAAKVALEGEKAALANERTALVTERDSLKGSVTTITGERDAARTALANERKGRAEAVVDLAIAQGKVALADRDTRIATLVGAADFPAAATALANEKVKHNTQGSDLGNRRGAAATATPRERLVALENEAQYAKITDYSARFDAIMRDHPDLKAQLNPTPATT